MQCPICAAGPVPAHDVGIVNKQYDCPRCGLWMLIPNTGERPPFTLDEVLGGWDRAEVHRRSRLSHIVRCQQRDGLPVAVQVHRLAGWALDAALPTPAEQLDRLLLWIADHQPSHSERTPLHGPEVAAWIGATVVSGHPDSGVGWLNQAAVDRGLATSGPVTRLTLEGWARVEELQRVQVTSRFGFMAMQFRDPDVEEVVASVFRPAVEAAGFELRTLEHNQGAGLIDDQLRVALRTSRFVVADLTRGNRGAYWEAGFAEGLGHPVIYTCRKAEWDAPRDKPHFDTNHLLTVVWDPDNLEDAGQRLKATIRATLPEEAKMED